MRTASLAVAAYALSCIVLTSSVVAKGEGGEQTRGIEVVALWAMETLHCSENRMVDSLSSRVGRPFPPHPNPGRWPAVRRLIAPLLHAGEGKGAREEGIGEAGLKRLEAEAQLMSTSPAAVAGGMVVRDDAASYLSAGDSLQSAGAPCHPERSEGSSPSRTSSRQRLDSLALRMTTRRAGEGARHLPHPDPGRWPAVRRLIAPLPASGGERGGGEGVCQASQVSLSVYTSSPIVVPVSTGMDDSAQNDAAYHDGTLSEGKGLPRDALQASTGGLPKWIWAALFMAGFAGVSVFTVVLARIPTRRTPPPFETPDPPAQRAEDTARAPAMTADQAAEESDG